MSLWTVSVVDAGQLLDGATRALVDTDVRYVMAYLDRFIDWKGTLDVQVNIKSHAELKSDLGWDTDGIIPATEMSWFGENGQLIKSNLIEMATGEDRNGDGADAGFTIYLGQDGTMRNYGQPVWLDPDPVFRTTPDIPPGAHDFVSIALHEILHTLAFDQADFATSTLGSHVTERDGVYYFEGAATMALLGEPLAFDAVGHVITALAPHYQGGGMLGDVGNYEQNRWDIGRIELAVMRDLGLDVRLPLSGLAYTDLDDKEPHIVGTARGDVLFGDFQDNVIRGGAGNDMLEGGAGGDGLDGEDGLDTAVYAGTAGSFTVQARDGGLVVTDRSGAEGIDMLENIERIRFADSALAFDLDGNAGMTFRIYQAAFDRVPDQEGLGFWLQQMDNGMSLQRLAYDFIISAEFAQRYGANPTATAFVTQLYDNILGRVPDQEGFDFWIGALAANDTLDVRASILAGFSESAENVALVAELIGNGIAYQPYGA